MSVTDSGDVPSLDRWLRILQDEGAPSASLLAPGLDHVEVDALARSHEIRLPDQVYSMYRRHNGAIDGATMPQAIVFLGCAWPRLFDDSQMGSILTAHQYGHLIDETVLPLLPLGIGCAHPWYVSLGDDYGAIYKVIWDLVPEDILVRMAENVEEFFSRLCELYEVAGSLVNATPVATQAAVAIAQERAYPSAMLGFDTWRAWELYGR